MTLLEKAKKESSYALGRKRSTPYEELTDEAATDLILAYSKGEINAVGVAAALRSIGYQVKTNHNLVGVLASRIFSLAKRGLIKIERA